jgi:4-hydroxyproline epimerase
MSSTLRRVRVVDCHTGGEPTRVVIEGGPDLGGGSPAEKLLRFRRDHDGFRTAVVAEPRGSQAMVGALLCEPSDPTCAAAVIFFDNAEFLGMCGHGTIGLVVTLAHLGRIGFGEVRIQTPVGVVSGDNMGGGVVAVRNVPARRTATRLALEVDGLGTVHGDVAWGGNWFFLVSDHRQRIAPDNLARLTQVSWAIRRALAVAGIRGDDGKEIDHVELLGPPSSPAVADGRNFVLCPGGAYDRSPCGTGTSAEVACLVADGKLRPGAVWRQESVIGSVFEASAELIDGQVIPTIIGSAHVTAEATLLLDPADPFRDGIRPAAHP